MARSYSNKRLSNRDFLTAGATPEMQNVQANAKDNKQELAAQALGATNKKLYDFIAQALQTSLANIVESDTLEFETLSQRIYSNIVDIVEGKMEDGDLADALVENLNIYNGEVKPSEGESTPQGQVPTPGEGSTETSEEVKGETKEMEGETTELQAPPISIDQPPIEVESLHETVTEERTVVRPTTEVVTQVQPKVDVRTEEVEAGGDEAPQEEPEGYFMSEEEMSRLKTKLKLLFIYLRSQKLDIFKILSGVDEGLVNIQDKREEIDLDYEEELRRRQNERKAFNRQLALDSAWYEKAFGGMEEDLEQDKTKPKSQKDAGKGSKEDQKESTPESETQKEPEREPEQKETIEDKSKATEPKKEMVDDGKARPQSEEPQVQEPEQPRMGPPKVEQPKVEQPRTQLEELQSQPKEQKRAPKPRPKKKVGLIGRVLNKVMSPFKASKTGGPKKQFVFVVVPVGTGVKMDGKRKSLWERLMRQSGIEERKGPSLSERFKTTVGNVKKKIGEVKAKIKAAPRALFNKAKEAIKKRLTLFKFKRDKKTKYFKYTSVIHVKNKKSFKLWGKEMKWKRLTKALAKKLGIQDDLPPGDERKDMPEGPEAQESEQAEKPKRQGILSWLKSKLFGASPKQQGLSLKSPTPPTPRRSIISRIVSPSPSPLASTEQGQQKRFSIRSMVARSVKRFVRRRVIKTKAAVRRVWRKVSRPVQKVWGRAKKRVRVVARKLKRRVKAGAKRVGKKVWGGLKKMGKRIFDSIKKVVKRVVKAVVKVAVKVGKAIYKIGKKMVATGYKVASKMTVTATRVIGQGIRMLGSAITGVPFVGWVLGPILTVIGTGISAASRLLKVAFNAIGHAASAAAKMAEKAFASFMKSVTKSKGGGFMPKLGNIGGTFKKFGFRGLFTQIGRSISSWTSKWRINGLAKKAMSFISSLGGSMKLKTPKFKIKGKWGSRKVQKEAQDFLQGIYMRGIGAVKTAYNTGFNWVNSTMNTMGEGMTSMISTLGSRIAVLGTAGIKGLLKALFSPTFLVSLGAVLVVIFHKKIFKWIKDTTGGTLKGIFTVLKNVGLKVWKFLTGVWNTLVSVGKWMWEQSDSDKRYTVAWWMKIGIQGIMASFDFIMKNVMTLVPNLNGTPFMLGMALGGYPWPLIGALIYASLKRSALNLWSDFRRTLRTYVGLWFCWLPGFLFRRLLKLVGLADVDPIWKKSAPTLDDMLKKVESADLQVDKLTVNMSAANYINPVLKDVGLPDLNKFNRSVLSRMNSSKSQVEKYNNFIKEAATVLTDKNKAPGASPGFYGSPKVTEALLSVFFFTDPMTGQVMSLIPKQNIPSVITGIQQLVLDAAEKNDARALANANTDVLNYFDYMNRGRSNVLANIAEKYVSFIDRLSAAKGDEQRNIAMEFTGKLKNGDFTADALKTLELDMMVKQGRATTADTNQSQLRQSHDESVVGRGSITSKGAMSLVNASNKGSTIMMKSGLDRLGDFTFTKKELGIQNKNAGDKVIVSKRESWLQYQREEKELVKQGKTQEELKALGYGMSATEWSKKYDEAKEKELKSGDFKMGRVSAKGGLPTPIKLKSLTPPRIVLPTVNFKSPAKQVKISLPGLTRDVTKGSKQYNLLNLSFIQANKEKQAKIDAKRKAWKKYQEEEKELVKSGKTQEELKALGYGLSAREWSEKYDAELKAKEKAEAEKVKKEQQADKTNDEHEKETERQVEQSDGEVEKLKQPSIPGDFSKLIVRMNKLHLDIKTALEGFTTASILPNLGIVRGDGKIERLDDLEKKKDGNKPKSMRAWLSGLERKSKDLKDATGLPKDDPLAFEKNKALANMSTKPPKLDDMKVKANPSEQEKVYQTAGVSLVSEAQWVSAQEAHRLEEKIIKNAKSVRDIIEGLNVMGDNLDNAKVDLGSMLKKIKDNPIGNVVNMPPTVVPGPLQIVTPEDSPDYDPLPPL